MCLKACFFCCLTFSQFQLQAQTLATPETAVISDRGSGCDAVANARRATGSEEIIRELEQMRARILQLETQLQEQSRGEPKPQNGTSGDGASASPGVNSQPVMLQTNVNENGAAPEKKADEPFAFADFTWLNGTPRTDKPVLDTKFFTGEFRFDTSYIYDFNHPADHTLSGTTESGRTGEFQVQQIGIGGDFHYDNVRGRVMTQLGMYSTMTPRNDPTVGRGQWNLDNAYRYVSEAYGGYHFDKLHGINVDAGIFLSYIGLFSYYNFDNWAYQPSYVSSNTPWFFNGVRLQIFPSDKLKVEGWLINGWQSYGVANGRPGLGLQVLYRPNGSLSFTSNNYGVGRDTPGAAHRTRWHTDDSVEVKYYDRPGQFVDKAAFSFTADAGCESGSGVSCFGSGSGGPRQSFVGAMFYNRLWFHKDIYAFTLGGGGINNPGRYLVLLPPINGATAVSGTPYFSESPGDQFKAWDVTGTWDYMPAQYVTFRFEYGHRATNIPYWSGAGGVTPPGGNVGLPGSLVQGFSPDLRKRENRLNMALLVKF